MEVAAMNKKYFFRNFLCLFIVSLSLSTQAVIIDGTFKGTVMEVSDNGDNDNPYFQDFFSSNLIGQSFTGSFWYDTDLAPVNQGTTGQWRTTENTNWLGITFNVDGKALNPAVAPSGYTQTSTWETQNIGEINWGTGIHDFTQEFFGVREDGLATDGTYTSSQMAGITFLDAIIPSLSGNSLLQDFTWHDDGAYYENWDDIPGLALYFNDTKYSGESIGVGLAARLSEITVSPRIQAEVPEPSAIMLLGFGLIALIIRQRKISR
jgi:hypothetical protein